MRGLRSARILEKIGYDVLIAYFDQGESIKTISEGYGFKQVDVSKPPYQKTFKWGPITYPLLNSIFGDKRGRGLTGLISTMYPNGIRDTLRELKKDHDISYAHMLGYPDGHIIPLKEVVDVKTVFDFRDVSTGISVDTLKRNYDISLFRALGFDTSLARRQANIAKAHEKEALERPEGVIFSSSEMQEYLLQKNPGSEPEKYTILENRPFLEDIPKEKHDKISKETGQVNVVYIGAISLDGYRNYTQYFKEVLDFGHALHIYTPSADSIRKEYSKKLKDGENLHFHDPLRPNVLLKEITRYDMGMIPFNRSRDTVHLDFAIPNKLYEYLACGLRVITSPIKTVSRIVTELEGGVVMEDGNDIGKLISQDIEENGNRGIKEPIERYCHESQIPGFKEFIHEIFV
jgi:glycosyltransferase involved in cell wall biosynthesis